MDVLLPDLVVLLQREQELEHLVRGRPPHHIVRIKVSKKAAPTSPQVRKQLRERLSASYFKHGRILEFSLDAGIFYRCYLFSGQPIVVNHPQVIWAERLPAYEGTLLYVKKPLSDRDRAALTKLLGTASLRPLVSGVERGVLVGLLDPKQHCQGMGIIESFDFSRRVLRVFTPVSDQTPIRGIVMGSVRYAPDGTESGFVEPGTF